MIKLIALVIILFIDFISYLCIPTVLHREHTMYPYLNDADMTAWRYVVKTGVLNWSIVSSFACILASFLLCLAYVVKLRVVAKHRIFSIVFTCLIVLSVAKMLLLVYNLNGLLKISSSLKPCVEKVSHIQCSSIQY